MRESRSRIIPNVVAKPTRLLPDRASVVDYEDEPLTTTSWTSR